MFSQEIRDIALQIANLSNSVSPELWMQLASMKNNLLAIAEDIHILENLPIELENLTSKVERILYEN